MQPMLSLSKQGSRMAPGESRHSHLCPGEATWAPSTYLCLSPQSQAWGCRVEMHYQVLEGGGLTPAKTVWQGLEKQPRSPRGDVTHQSCHLDSTVAGNSGGHRDGPCSKPPPSPCWEGFPRHAPHLGLPTFQPCALTAPTPCIWAGASCVPVLI